MIIVLSLFPSDDLPDQNWDWFPHVDKVVHFIMYAVLTFLILAKNHIFFSKYQEIKVLTITFLYVFLMGFFIEIMQNSFLIGRNFDIFDVVANTTGALVVVVLYKTYHHLN